MKKKPAETLARPRGGASCPCPKCKNDSRVLKTTRDNLIVSRMRECLGKDAHRFYTHEVAEST